MSTATAPAATRPPEAGKKRAALARDLSELLVELSIAVHRFSIYPRDHPSLEPAAENVIRGLTRILQDRKSLPLGVARRQLVIEGIATDPDHPVLSDLARRLHGHQLALVRFDRGVALDQLLEFLEALSEEPDRGGQALGLLPPEHRPQWKGLVVLPIGYEALELTEEEREHLEPPRVRQLWLGLAQAALRAEAPPDDEVPGGRMLAEVIQDRGGEEAYDKVIVGYLHQMAEELSGAEGPEAESARRMVSDLVESLDPETLTRLLSLGGAHPQRKRFLADANQSRLTAQSVIRILESAAAVEGQHISTSVARLLRKLATHAGGRNRNMRAEAESAIREVVEDLIADWDLVDPNPDAYTLLLDRMSDAHPLLSGNEDQESVPGADRIVQMAIEVDQGGATLQKAVSDLLDEGRIADLFGFLDQAPEGSAVASELLERLTSSTQLQRLLSGADVHEATLQAVVRRIGTAAVEPLFQALTESESRAVRRRAFDCLAGAGLDLSGIVAEKLDDERWFVQRNMLALLQEMEHLPPEFDARTYLRHEDPRVRREALGLAMRDPAVRDQALALALRDPEERLVRTALLELQEGLPDTLVPIVVSRVLRSKSYPQLRGLAAQALGANRSTLARDALLDLCSRKHLIFRRRRLTPGSPAALAALAALARRWGDDPAVKPVLERARNARDSRIRAAAAIPEDQT